MFSPAPAIGIQPFTSWIHPLVDFKNPFPSLRATMLIIQTSIFVQRKNLSSLGTGQTVDKSEKTGFADSLFLYN
ncbi:hypothetical protein BSM4216_2997 [Bacillus smithii]|nr:hypothetical protein BSM4216_2997 [Bacillus smithii]